MSEYEYLYEKLKKIKMQKLKMLKEKKLKI